MIYHPNYSLARSQGIDEAGVTAIEEVGQHLLDILENPLTMLKADDVAPVVQALETTLQRLWKFPYDPSMFRYQYAMKGCTCDRLRGQGNKAWMDGTCPFHNLKRD